MAFLDDTEFILYMDCQMANGQYLGIEDLKRLRDAGMRTAYHCYTRWDSFIVNGQPDWGYFDRYLERMHQANMKALIVLWQVQSNAYPSDWYCLKESRQKILALSPWCAEAQDEHRRVLRLAIKHYTSDKVQFVMGQHQGNERVLINQPAYYDRYAIADWRNSGHEGIPDHTTPEGAEWLKQSYIRLMTDLMAVFVDTPHREAWYALSRYKVWRSDISCHGCEWIDDYLQAWQALKPKQINHVSFNYFPYGQAYWDLIHNKNHEYHVNEYVGAEYCEGLRDGNGTLAVNQGLRGMIVGPTHALTGHRTIDDWMVAQIAATHNAFTQREQEKVKPLPVKNVRKTKAKA